MTSEARNLPLRSAMYYPRIHFPDLEWGKATLLTFGRIHRIVPYDDPLLRDPPEVRAITTWDPTDRSKLVINVNPENQDIELAQGRVFNIVDHTDGAILRSRFGRDKTTEQYEIHSSKIHAGLFDRLEHLQLVWPADRTNPNDPYRGIHPQLGEAIMGVSAISTARRTGSDVVTSEPSLHAALAAVDETALLRSIFKPAELATEEVAADRATSQLVHAVMTTRFDLSSVKMDDIVELAKDGVDLRAFRSCLLAFAERIPPEVDQATRDRLIEELTAEVILGWSEFRGRLPKRLKESFKESINDVADETVTEATKSVLALGVVGALGAITAPVLLGAAIAAAVPITLKLFRAARASRREADDPSSFRFLTKVTQQGGMLLATPRVYRAAGAPARDVVGLA